MDFKLFPPAWRWKVQLLHLQATRCNLSFYWASFSLQRHIYVFSLFTARVNINTESWNYKSDMTVFFISERSIGDGDLEGDINQVGWLMQIIYCPSVFERNIKEALEQISITFQQS